MFDVLVLFSFMLTRAGRRLQGQVFTIIKQNVEFQPATKAEGTREAHSAQLTNFKSLTISYRSKIRVFFISFFYFPT